MGPEEIVGRKEELGRFVKEIHDAGVDNVFCYINPSILGGDHETRKGFWGLYDHWEDYEEKQLCRCGRRLTLGGWEVCGDNIVLPDEPD